MKVVISKARVNKGSAHNTPHGERERETMTEWQMFMEATNGTREHKTSIIKYPTGKFGFVGDVPDSLGTWGKNRLGQAIFNSNVYGTREEAENALGGVKS